MDMTHAPAVLALGDLVAAFHVEASRHPDTRAILIRQQADALDGIRLRTVTGMLEHDDALAWLDAGRLVLSDLIMSRCLTDSPALDIVRSRLRHDD